ncbi:MAG: ArsA family ATPase [Bdellovibrionales bacterium]
MKSISELLQKKVIVCAGTGGVGKTTLSASLAVAAAQQGKCVLVLTIDPAKRLATALGIEALGREDRRVPEQNYPGELFAAVVDSKFVFDDFVVRALPDKTDCEKILKNRIYQKLSTSLSGSQEFTSLERFLMSYRSKKYDLIVLDTPPAGHAMDFLDGAAKLEALFQDSVLKWFVKPFQRTGLIVQIVNRSTNIAFSALERLTGAEFLKELFEFFSTIYVIKDALLEEVRSIQQVLENKETAFVIVSGFDSTKLEESQDFYDYLQKRRYRFGALIVNRCLPSVPTLEGGSAVAPTEARESFLQSQKIYSGLQHFYKKHEQALSRLERHLGKDSLVIRVEDSDQEIWDLQGLEKMAHRLR